MVGEFWLGVCVLVPIRVLSAWRSGVADCDEVYNYWEAAYLVSGLGHAEKGFQTWEYAPKFALRSWAFAAPFGLAARWLGMTGVKAVALAVPSAAAEAALAASAGKAFDGFWCCVCLLAASPGVFVSSASLLPSSACLTLATLNQALWLRDAWRAATFFAVVAVLWPGWPFVAVLFVPFALDTLSRYPFLDVVRVGFLSGVVVLAPAHLADAVFYGSLKVSPLLNIFRYNALGNGDELYGVEPASFYVKNLVLNATPVVLALACVGAVGSKIGALHLSPCVVWMATLFARPHKEERFTYPALASLAVAASIGLRARTANRPRLRCLVLVAALSIGGMRLAALDRYYWQPQHAIWRAAKTTAISFGVDAKQKPVTVCVGKEWYRYPSSYRLAPNARLGFLESSFSGQLPRPWSNASWSTAASDASVDRYFNDLNLPDPERFVPVAACDLAVDLVLDPREPSPSVLAALDADRRTWEPIYTVPFLDASQTPALARAFLIPFYSIPRAVFKPYVLFAPTTSTS